MTPCNSRLPTGYREKGLADRVADWNRLYAGNAIEARQRRHDHIADIIAGVILGLSIGMWIIWWWLR